MTLCWNFDEDGKVIGMCGGKELARRINDPNYMPEFKAMRKKFIEEENQKKQDAFHALPPERKEELRQDIKRFLRWKDD
jgi:hypothetical protein